MQNQALNSLKFLILFLFDRYITIEFIKHNMGFSVKEKLNSAKYCVKLDILKNIFPNAFYITSSGN